MGGWEWTAVAIVGWATFGLALAGAVGWANWGRGGRVPRGPLDEHGDGSERERLVPLPALAHRGRRPVLAAAAVAIVLGLIAGMGGSTATGLVLVVAGLILAAGA